MGYDIGYSGIVFIEIMAFLPLTESGFICEPLVEYYPLDTSRQAHAS